uniref:Uncharacterized protein n=1 Tax=Anguilla anguilla TaxID=7936 RepID=A0A0E9VEG6_ANGAN
MVRKTGSKGTETPSENEAEERPGSSVACPPYLPDQQAPAPSQEVSFICENDTTKSAQ